MNRLIPILIDVALVFVFAAVGRASHAEALDGAGLTRTAMPFVAAALMGAVVMTLRNADLSQLKPGVIQWAIVLAGGMLFRTMIGDGVQFAFIVVAAIFLALFLIGWRAIWWLVSRKKSA